MILFKAPELNWEFDFTVSSNDWVYFTIDVTIPGSESYPEGIVRINKKTDKLDFVASPFAYGVKENRGKAYFFWHSSEDNDEGGIYQLDLDTSHIKKIGPLPNLSTHPAYNWGEITKIEDENIYFFWVGDTEEDEGTYNLDIKSGVIQKVTN